MNFEKVLTSLGVKYFKSKNLLIGPCPIHDGDNETAFNLTISGKYAGLWFCNTMKCHEEYPGYRNLIKQLLIDKGIYSEDYLNELAQLEIVKPDPFSILYNDEELESGFNKHATNIPSSFYQKKGFSPAILKEFEIGDCFSKGEMYNRVVFPVYSIDGVYLGCVGRTMNNDYSKWKNSKDLQKSKTLYGIWKTQEEVKKKGSIVLVEGQGDFLKLYQNGVRNCAGMFSSSLCNGQIKLLFQLGVHTIILLKDNDEAGNKGFQKMKHELSEMFHIVCPEYSGKDVGVLSDEHVKFKILPLLGV
jgi:5S rRNA maturation endonuclease (ribonuclease M5)